MGKISKKIKKNSMIISNKIIENETINYNELRLINSGNLTYFAPLEIKKGIFSTKLESNITGKVSFEEFRKFYIKKNVFLSIVMQLIQVIRICGNHSMYIKNISFELDNIFINRNDNSILVIYWPIVNSQRIINLVQFFNKLISSVTFETTENREFISQYMSFLNSQQPFSLDEFEKCVASLFSDDIDCNDGNREDIENETDINLEDNYMEEVMLNNDNDLEDMFEKTVALSADEMGDLKLPYLIRKSTGEKIEINKNIFQIGKLNNISDYVIIDNKTVSRQHAVITVKDGSYYLKDLNSKNGTYINNKQILPNIECLLESGMKIRFSNEEFEFFYEI